MSAISDQPRDCETISISSSDGPLTITMAGHPARIALVKKYLSTEAVQMQGKAMDWYKAAGSASVWQRIKWVFTGVKL